MENQSLPTIWEIMGINQDESPKVAPNKAKRNPRLVFVDPDSFFRDLLMEQEEQG